METIVVYSPNISPRLTYVLDWLIKERLQLSYTLIDTKPTNSNSNALIISYGATSNGAISIPDVGLLWETGVADQKPAAGIWQELPTLFSTNDDSMTLNFDMLSAIFYLLSRYEEYYTYTPDKHNRYPPTESILYRKGLLSRPIVDEWVDAFRRMLNTTTGKNIPQHLFTYLPTYDIDIAYSHLHKGVRRIFGAYLRAILRMDMVQIAERTRVLKKKQKDPYDSFRWLRQVHKLHNYRPIYFILCAAKTSAFDKNIHPLNPAMIRVIKNVAKDGEIGIHPSYYSYQESITRSEINTLQNITNQTIKISRQHYIKIKMPETYKLLIANNIEVDYSMGYGSKLGFRAGTGSSFLWYNIQNETTTNLRIYPFCFMDTTAHYELRLTPQEAIERLTNMTRILRKTGSQLTTVYHNFSLGMSTEWTGWRQAYEAFLEENKPTA